MDAQRDENHVTTLLAASSANDGTTVALWADPVSHRLLVTSNAVVVTPGGLNTQLQYNNNGSFGGITGAVTDGTAVSLTAPHLLNPTINGAGTGLATLTYPNTATSVSIAFPTTAGTLALTSQLTSGTVTSVATDATLTGGPITTTGTLGINLSNTNTWLAPIVIQSNSATAFVVGLNGTTNPVFNIDASTTSQVDGITIKGGGAGAGTTIITTSSGANSGVTLTSIGSGVSALNAASTSGSVQLQITGGTHLTVNSTALTGVGQFKQTDQASAVSTTRFQFIGATDTALPTGVEATSFLLNIGQTRTFTGSTGFALQRAVRIQQPTYAYAVATGTITEASTFVIDGAPIAGTNTAITTAYALKVTTGNTYLGGKIGNYNAINTTGWGVPAIYGTGRATAQVAANASVATYTVGAADGSFNVSANVLITTSTLFNFTVTCSYTDEGNTARVLTLQFSNLAGTFVTAIANAAGTVPYEGVPLHIRAKSGTVITIATAAGGTYTTVVYNVEGSIIQIA